MALTQEQQQEASPLRAGASGMSTTQSAYHCSISVTSEHMGKAVLARRGQPQRQPQEVAAGGAGYDVQ